ncbi:hypothetical protein GOP47_0017185 [Adiantum capillus-veneris]|uniref:Pentatricopeptide repeat-containing protein n=1 Tax=Adiantum capillus-veneris TaxID=13818 RepID=A0A9D4UJ65_ADICA|nr:hypothetical protein GOP47_0017185 [Adiantum capillus-veneris]
MGVLSIQHWTNVGSETAGMQGFDRLSRDDDAKPLSDNAFAASFASCTHLSPDVTAPFSCFDALSVQKDLKLQSVPCNAFHVLDLENRVCLEEQSTIAKPSIREQLSDAITWQPCSGIAIPIQQGSNTSQLSRPFPSLFEQINVDDSPDEFPSIGTFLDILQSCRAVSSLMHAKQAHLHICNNGLEAQKDVGNYLVPILVECGAVDYAKQVFHRLMYQNEHSWTSLIQGHVVSGNIEQALTLYQLMLRDLIEPSNFTFVVLLKACAQANDVERGKFFHMAIAKRGVEQDSFVGSVLVDMYTKCGLLSEARHVLSEMSVEDVFPWTSIISGYVELGFAEEALVCREEMEKSGLSPDAHTIACCLKACADLGAIEEGFKLHTMLIEMGFTRDVFAGNGLMEMYTKCGTLLEVRKVFEGLPVRDRISWTSMIAAYVEHDGSNEALDCLEPMHREGVSPAAATFVCILKACTSISAIDDLRFLHSEVIKKGFEGDVSVGNTLVDMYAKCQSLAEAWEVLSKLQTQTAVSWTAFMAGCLEQEGAEQVLDSFEQMKTEGIHVDEALSVCILRACCNLGALGKGFETHINILKIGFDNNTFVGNTLVGP